MSIEEFYEKLVEGFIKGGVPRKYFDTKKSTNNEQYAVYEKEPRHGKDRNGVILAPFNTSKEAEEAKIKYGYGDDNYYVDKVNYLLVNKQNENE